MAPAVRETLIRMHHAVAGIPGCPHASNSDAWLEELEAAGRYSADVFG